MGIYDTFKCTGFAMEYKCLPKDLATRLTEAYADVLNDAFMGGGCEVSSESAGKVKLFPRTVSCAALYSV